MALTDEHIEKHFRRWLTRWRVDYNRYGLTANQLAYWVKISTTKAVDLLDAYDYDPFRCESTKSWVWRLPAVHKFYGYNSRQEPYLRSEAVAWARRQANSKRDHFGTNLTGVWEQKLGVGKITRKTTDETCGHCIAEKQLGLQTVSE